MSKANDRLSRVCSVLIGYMSFVCLRLALDDQMDLVVGRTLNGLNNSPAEINSWSEVNGRIYECCKEYF